MPRTLGMQSGSKELWLKKSFGEQEFFILNLDHPEIDRRVMSEISAGVAVYCDAR